MERNEIKAINQALTNNGLVGAGALVGVAQLCAELVAAGAISAEAAARVGKAITTDIDGTPSADWQARRRVVGVVDALFARYSAEGDTPPPQQ